MSSSPLFRSYFLAGFECSSQRRRDGRRLDLLASTRHDELVEADYRQVLAHGMRAARDGLRWHRIETAPGRYDWSSFLPMLQAARRQGVQVVWDLCHYGVPPGLDIWGAGFVERFARFAAAAARLIRDETGKPLVVCPVNEISFWAWAGGDQAKFYPAARGRGDELKRQLARAAIAAVEAVRGVDADARFVHTDPLIQLHPRSGRPDDVAAAATFHEAQFQSWDMISGRLAPELGGRPEHLDVLGVNYYSDNQWVFAGHTRQLGHPEYRPFRELLADAHRRYGRPLFVAETGAEGSARAAWLCYVAGEVRAARAAGVPVEGICLYPVVDYPGWEDERHCDVGLFAVPDGDGRRPVHHSLAEELRRWQEVFDAPDQQEAAVHLLDRAG